MKNKLKKLIQKAVPEIMELKFGCEVNTNLKTSLKHNKSFKVSKSKIVGKGECKNFHIGIWECIWLEVPQNTLKILGRPITLADVLIALNKKKDDDYWYSCTTEGEIRKEWNIIGREHHGIESCGWNLKEDLDNQSDEVIEFLYSLIK